MCVSGQCSCRVCKVEGKNGGRWCCGRLIDVDLRGSVPIFEAALLLGLAPKNFVVAIRVERRVDVNQIDARLRQLTELVEIIAAVDNASVEQRGRFWGH